MERLSAVTSSLPLCAAGTRLKALINNLPSQIPTMFGLWERFLLMTKPASMGCGQSSVIFKPRTRSSVPGN